MDTQAINPSSNIIRSILLLFNKKIFCVLLLLFLTVLAYVPVFQAQFIQGKDDAVLIKNDLIVSSDTARLDKLLKMKVEGTRSPLSNLVLFLEHRFFGLDPFFFHLNSLLLHAAVVCSLFILALAIGLKQQEAFLGTLIFALHPSKVEAVAWVGARQELLAAFFCVMTLIAYRKDRYWPAVVLYIAALLSNPTAAFLPVVLFVFDRLSGKKIDASTVLSKWPYFLAGTVIVWKNYLQFLSLSDVTVIDVLCWYAWALCFYLQQFAFPVVLVPIYAYPEGTAFFKWPYIAIFIIIGLMILGLWKWRKQGWAATAMLVYALLILSSLRLDLGGQLGLIADRHAYLASGSLSLLSALALFKANDFLKTQEPLLRYLFQTAVVLLMAGFFLLTFNQASFWRNAQSLWRYQLKVSPHPAAYDHLAEALKAETGTDQERIGLYKQAIVKDPLYLDSYIKLGRLYQDRSYHQEALNVYRAALKIDHKYVKALLGEASVLQQQGRAPEVGEILKGLLRDNPDDEDVYAAVIESYGQALKAYPKERLYQLQREEALSEYEELSRRKKYSSGDYFNLGFLYEQVGGYEEALRFYRKALEINPRHEKALYRLAKHYQEAGDLKSALILYQQLVQVNPKNIDAYLNMGIIYNASGEVSRAKMFYHKTIGLDKNNAGAYFNLGYLYESAGDLKEALNYYEKAVENDAQMAEVYYNMGNVYAALGQTPEAIASYLKTVAVDKTHQNAFVNLSILSFKSRDFAGALRYLEEARKLGYTAPAEYLRSLEPYKRK